MSNNKVVPLNNDNFTFNELSTKLAQFFCRIDFLIKYSK